MFVELKIRGVIITQSVGVSTSNLPLRTFIKGAPGSIITAGPTEVAWLPLASCLRKFPKLCTMAPRLHKN